MTLIPNEKSAFLLAAMDLDDTLLGPNKQISSANAAAVCELRARGIRVVLASGRRHGSMLRFHQQLALDGPIVSCQGALVQTEAGQTLYQQFVPANLAAELVQRATAEGGTLAYYHTDAVYVAERNAFTELYQSRGGDEIVVYGDLNRLSGEEPMKIIWLDEPARTTARLASGTERYLGQLELVITSPEYLEFTASGISKSVGLEVVAKHYGIAASQVLAFGDGNNDVSMLQWAGMGVAMSIATPAAKAAASLIAPPGDIETSLARSIEELLKRM